MEAQSLEMAVRLADEGVPLRAIARAIKIPSADLREQLTEAKLDGRLLELPHDDWPPGFPRDQRSLQISRLVRDNRDALMLAVRQLFGLTPAEVQLLLVLLQRPLLNKPTTDSTIVEVHVHYIRKRLAPFGISITTVWGSGYQLTDTHRRRTMDLILARVAQPVV
jgi:DNA-binding response OmpR family regulator